MTTLHPVFDEDPKNDLTPEPSPFVGLVAVRPLQIAADIERKIREENHRHERLIADLRDEYDTIVETAIAIGHTEEAHPYGTYRIVEEIKPGRRSIDDAAFRDRYPEYCETVLKAPTLAKAERLLRPDELALVVKQGEAKVSRELKFEPAPLPFEECEE